MADIKLYTSDYGHTINVRTYLADIGSATDIKIKMKRPSDGATAEIDASYVPGEVDDDGDLCYVVQGTVANGFLTTKAGLWVCGIVATFASGVFTSEDTFLTRVRASPIV